MNGSEVGGQSEWRVGSLFDRKYRLLGPLGRGGMGVVYEALNVATGRRVALKFLDPRLADQPDVARRFELEARAAALINHPGIVQVLDSGRSEDGTAYIVMEHLEGATLRQLQKEGELFDAGQAAGVMLPVLDALGAAHASGVVHRDLKPANIFVVVKPERSIKVLDFGISKFSSAGGALTKTGASIGTPAFMAPEQLTDSKVADARSDLYAIGATLYALVTGRPPFDSDAEFEVIAQILTRPHRPLAQVRPDLPRDFASIVDRLLAKSPEARWQSAEEVKEALSSCSEPELESTFAAAEAVALAPRPIDSVPVGAGDLASPVGRRSVGVTISDRAREDRARAPWAMVLGALTAIGAIATFGAWRLLRAEGEPGPASAAPPTAVPAPTGLPVPASGAPKAQNGGPPVDLERFATGELQAPDPSGFPPQTRASLAQKPGERLERFIPVMERAREMFKNRNSSDALALLEGEAAQLKFGPDRVAYAYAVRNLGNLASDGRDCDDALAHFVSAARLFAAMGDFAGVGLALNDVGYLANDCKAIPPVPWFRLALSARFFARDYDGLIKTTNNLATRLNADRDHEEAAAVIDDALLAAKEEEDVTQEVVSSFRAGHSWALAAEVDLYRERSSTDGPPEQHAGFMRRASYFVAKGLERGKNEDPRYLDYLCGLWLDVPEDTCARLMAQARKRGGPIEPATRPPNPVREKALRDLSRARALAERGDRARAVSMLDDAVRAAKRGSNRRAEAWALAARVRLDPPPVGEGAACEANLDRILRASELVQSSKDFWGKAEISALAAVHLHACGNTIADDDWAETALAEFWEAGDLEGVVENTPALVSILEDRGQLARVDRALADAVIAAHGLDKPGVLARALSDRAGFWHRRSRMLTERTERKDESTIDPRSPASRRTRHYLEASVRRARQEGIALAEVCARWEDHARHCESLAAGALAAPPLSSPP